MIDKHFINDQTRLVIGALRTAAYANPSLSLDETNRVVYCTAPDPHHVAVVSGGGAGHEPSFASCVLLTLCPGQLLTAATGMWAMGCCARR